MAENFSANFWLNLLGTEIKIVKANIILQRKSHLVEIKSFLSKDLRLKAPK